MSQYNKSNFSSKCTSISYKDAGVNIDDGNKLVQKIKSACKATHRQEVLGELGGFGGLFALNNKKYSQPILVAATDGVGTKIKLAIEHNRHQTIGQDLVAMCVNDLIVQGAEPLFFLDYYATSKLEIETASQVIKSIAKACKDSNCALLGGETAEMPGMYKIKDYDLAGFCVGIVEKQKIINGSKITAGNKIIGLASSGIHSNGYSLVNKILERKIKECPAVLQKPLPNAMDSRPLLDRLLEPTKLYVKPIMNLLQKIELRGIAHITGGGITENLPRIYANNLQAKINLKAIKPFPELFQWLQNSANINDAEMLKTFNCGIGMALIISDLNLPIAMEELKREKLTPKIIGEITECTTQKPKLIYV